MAKYRYRIEGGRYGGEAVIGTVNPAFASYYVDRREELVDAVLESEDWAPEDEVDSDALLDPDIDLVILTGPAGCGKTLLALASALEMVVERGIYDKVIVTRSTPEIAESIGFLPGTEEEKMAPWLAAITDSLEVFINKMRV